MGFPAAAASEMIRLGRKFGVRVSQPSIAFWTESAEMKLYNVLKLPIHKIFSLIQRPLFITKRSIWIALIRKPIETRNGGKFVIFYEHFRVCVPQADELEIRIALTQSL